MNVSEVVSKLVEIRMARKELDAQETELMAQLSNRGGHTNGTIKHKPRQQYKKSKFSYYTRKKLSTLRKKKWEAMTAEQRNDRIQKMQAGRKVKK